MPRRTIFLDRDGVINRLRMGQYVTRWEDFEFLEGAKEAIAHLASAGYLIIIITNQSVINRGMLTESELVKIHERMVREIEKAGGRIDDIYYCPHTPEEKCRCRKPETGLFEQASREHDIDYENSWFVGDFESDRQVAERVGLKFILASGDGGLKSAVERILAEDGTAGK